MRVAAELRHRGGGGFNVGLEQGVTLLGDLDDLLVGRRGVVDLRSRIVRGFVIKLFISLALVKHW